MKVLDYRPWPTRLAHTLWRDKVADTPGLRGHSSSAGWGLGSVISAITRQRIKNRPQAPDSPYIVSVGNLALGGTGKTPVVSALARDLARLGFLGAVLTRGYRSPLAGPVVVTQDLKNAGDEARLLAREIQPSGWIVVQSKNRLDGLHWLQKNKMPLDIVIAEDAHQTPNLPRHLDVLILDRWNVDEKGNKKIVSPVSGSIFPFGPNRENSIGALRAGIWLLEEEGADHYLAPEGLIIDVATFRREVKMAPVTDPSVSYGVLSGIARPWRFEESMAQNIGRQPALAVRCNDHDSYGPNLVQKIVGGAREAKVAMVFTTAKDWVKLQDVWPKNLPLVVADLNILWGKGKTLPELIRERLNCYNEPAG